MKQTRYSLLFAGLVIVAMTAFGLVVASKRQTLGEPGVRVSGASISNEHGKICATNSVMLPESVGDLLSKEGAISDQELDWLPKDTTFGRRIYYYPDGYAVQASAILMGRDRTSIHKPEYCLVGQGWSIDKQETVEISLETSRPQTLRAKKFTVHIKGKDPKGKMVEMGGLYVFWFVADGMLTDTHWKRMEWQVRDLLFKGVLDRWAYISYFRPCAPGTENADYERMKTVISKTAPLFMKPGVMRQADGSIVARNE